MPTRSYARIDLLAVFPSLDSKMLNLAFDIAWEVGFDAGKMISIVPAEKNELKRLAVSPFYHAVKREEITVWARSYTTRRHWYNIVLNVLTNLWMTRGWCLNKMAVLSAWWVNPDFGHYTFLMNIADIWFAPVRFALPLFINLLVHKELEGLVSKLRSLCQPHCL